MKKRLDKEQIMTIIDTNKDKISMFGVKKLSLFGSYAQDRQRGESDIDFLVEFDKGRGLFDDYTGLLHFLESKFGKKVDLVKPKLIRDEIKSCILEGKKYEAEI